MSQRVKALCQVDVANAMFTWYFIYLGYLPCYYKSMSAYKRTRGFTIVELLIVIVVIAILATITIVAYRGIQARARDSQRMQDMSQIKKALLLYDALKGGVVRPVTLPYYNSEVVSTGRGGWDVSSDTNWLAFLVPEYGKMPVDPVNKLVENNVGHADTRVYRYFCYPKGSGPMPEGANVVLGYRADAGPTKSVNFIVTDCL